MPEIRRANRGRRDLPRRAAPWTVATAMGLSALAAAPAAGRERAAPVTLGEVASQVTSTSLPDIVELLKRDAQHEIAEIDWTAVAPRGPWTVSASVVRLSTVHDERTLTAWCTVSAALRDQKTGALVAIVEGRAQSDAPAAGRSAAARAERSALSGAVRGAVMAIPSAIARMHRGP